MAQEKILDYKVFGPNTESLKESWLNSEFYKRLVKIHHKVAQYLLEDPDWPSLSKTELLGKIKTLAKDEECGNDYYQVFEEKFNKFFAKNNDFAKKNWYNLSEKKKEKHKEKMLNEFALFLNTIIVQDFTLPAKSKLLEWQESPLKQALEAVQGHANELKKSGKTSFLKLLKSMADIRKNIAVKCLQNVNHMLPQDSLSDSLKDFIGENEFGLFRINSNKNGPISTIIGKEDTAYRDQNQHIRNKILSFLACSEKNILEAIVLLEQERDKCYEKNKDFKKNVKALLKCYSEDNKGKIKIVDCDDPIISEKCPVKKGCKNEIYLGAYPKQLRRLDTTQMYRSFLEFRTAGSKKNGLASIRMSLDGSGDIFLLSVDGSDTEKNLQNLNNNISITKLLKLDLEKPKEREDFSKTCSYLYWMITQITPFYRGTAFIAHMFIATIFLTKGLDLPDFQKLDLKVNPDILSAIYDFEEFHDKVMGKVFANSILQYDKSKKNPSSDVYCQESYVLIPFVRDKK